MKDINALFEQAEGEYLEFQRVKTKLSPRRDLCAFLLLDSLVPSSENMIEAHDDNLFFGIDVASLARSSITDEQVIDLVRCGVICSGKKLYMLG